ncbi:MAG: hypothetical protein U5L96_14330 [Owenweeksia sp.]|nr:hypothetical protein [Owenweeksia sp.]
MRKAVNPPIRREAPKEVKTKNQDNTEDEDLQFEVRQVESKSSGGPGEGGARSPMDSTIQESMQMQAEERKAKFKAFNYRFKNHPFSVDDTDNEPAYKRQGVKIEDTNYSKESRAGRFTIEDGEGGSDIKTNNSFLHDNVD